LGRSGAYEDQKAKAQGDSREMADARIGEL
jgi:hypothetical protein